MPKKPKGQPNRIPNKPNKPKGKGKKTPPKRKGY